MDYIILRDELLAGHPVTGAYNATDQLAADEINAVNVSTNLSILTGDVIFNATDNAEFAALTDHKRELWVSFCSKDINPFATANVNFVTWIFGGGSTTLASLASLRTELQSRSTILGLGGVTAGHIEYARTL